MNRIIVIKGLDNETKNDFLDKGYSVMGLNDYSSSEELGIAANEESKKKTICIDDCFTEKDYKTFLSKVDCKVYLISLEELSKDDYRNNLNVKMIERTPYLCQSIISEINLIDMLFAYNKAERYMD